ncbi:hypothetical protein [Piscinibacter sp. HJYY11]|uniref:hypothetical protein n=1 Tax=Piscinibacter sp. HJYY11 TaxID=2801333 RepID=UPI00191D6497|nr:hypothetical protein [Piscinibacter sp. HJYY11]MBL0726394.1 hypothetical protein [Piscinibacter sp. HJYY11]
MFTLTPQTDNVQFLHALQQGGLTSDWLPFKQSEWIAEKLHGGIPTKSPHASGVCNEMSAWMMTKWMKEGPSSRYIAQLDRDDAAQAILGMVEARDSAPAHVKCDYDYFAYLMSRAGVGTSHNAMVYDTAAKAIDAAKNLGNCAICMHDINGPGDGHTIICSGTHRSVFDPNVGFVRAIGPHLGTILTTIVNTRYPELKKGAIGIVSCK